MKTRLIFAFWLASLTVSWAQVGDVQITFKVMDDSGKPVPGSAVSVFAVRQKSLLIPLTISNAEQKETDAVTGKEGLAVIKASSVLDGRVYAAVFAIRIRRFRLGRNGSPICARI
jgi:molybdopterin-binding protein